MIMINNPNNLNNPLSAPLSPELQTKFDLLVAGNLPLSYSSCSDLLAGWNTYLAKRFLDTEKKDTPSTLLGRQFERMILGKTPESEFVVIDDKLNLATKEGRDRAKEAEDTKRLLIRETEFERLYHLREYLRLHGLSMRPDFESGQIITTPIGNPIIQGYFDPNARFNYGFGDNAEDAPTYPYAESQPVFFRGEADIYSPDNNIIIDLKISTDVRKDWSFIVEDFDYDLQAAVYCMFIGCDRFGHLVYHRSTAELTTVEFTKQTIERGREKLHKAVQSYLSLVDFLRQEKALQEEYSTECSARAIIWKAAAQNKKPFKLTFV